LRRLGWLLLLLEEDLMVVKLEPALSAAPTMEETQTDQLQLARG
jgi:hypothetical protein